jgi:predicted DsbA family dithiol-disulfide isomerase
MQDLQIKLYSTPTCGACRTLKTQLPKSQYVKNIQEINLLADEEEFKYARDHNVASVPTIRVTYGDREFFITGLRPIDMIDGLITEFINY